MGLFRLIKEERHTYTFDWGSKGFIHNHFSLLFFFPPTKELLRIRNSVYMLPGHTKKESVHKEFELNR